MELYFLTPFNSQNHQYPQEMKREKSLGVTETKADNHNEKNTKEDLQEDNFALF